METQLSGLSVFVTEISLEHNFLPCFRGISGKKQGMGQELDFNYLFAQGK
jgi:hypothetical protein